MECNKHSVVKKCLHLFKPRSACDSTAQHPISNRGSSRFRTRTTAADGRACRAHHGRIASQQAELARVEQVRPEHPRLHHDG